MASASSPLPAPARLRADGDIVTTVARRLTPRDRKLCHVLFDHRVLTTGQITELCFGSPITAQHRLVTLYRLRVLDRFRHYRHVGSDPYHYVLDAIGAELVAADRGIELEPGRVRSRALALSGSQRLAHLLGVNGLFCSLAGAASRSREAELVEWWPERRCTERWGEVVRPDGFGALRSEGQVVEFFVEYDGGTETLARLAGKLDGYADLVRATEWAPWVAFWFPSPRRAAEARAVLDHPAVPVVTGANGTERGPGGAAWLPVGSERPRRRLVELRPTGDARSYA
jgi:hypothetical protein